MRTLFVASMTGLVTACGGAGSPGRVVVEATATVELRTVEGDHWVLYADNGRHYLPRPDLPEALRVEGARVDVKLVERPDVVTAMPGIVADIARIEAHSCIGFLCGAAPPITVSVSDATSPSFVVRGVAIENLEAPPPAPPFWPARAACSEGTERADQVLRSSSCTIDGPAPGTYSFDVGAPGLQTEHVVVDVPAAPHVPGLCCQLGFLVRSLEVELAPP